LTWPGNALQVADHIFAVGARQQPICGLVKGPSCLFADDAAKLTKFDARTSLERHQLGEKELMLPPCNWMTALLGRSLRTIVLNG
jgi:hypothetical protein